MFMQNKICWAKPILFKLWNKSILYLYGKLCYLETKCHTTQLCYFYILTIPFNWTTATIRCSCDNSNTYFQQERSHSEFHLGTGTIWWRISDLMLFLAKIERMNVLKYWGTIIYAEPELPLQRWNLTFSSFWSNEISGSFEWDDVCFTFLSPSAFLQFTETKISSKTKEVSEKIVEKVTIKNEIEVSGIRDNQDLITGLSRYD